MKKSTTIILSAALSLSCMASCFAMVKEHQANIGEIYQGMTAEQVVAVQRFDYNRTNLARNRYGLTFKNGLYVEFTGNAVSYIEVPNNCGVKTADSLHVGSTMGRVEDALGRADYIEGNYHIYQASGQKDIAFVYDKDQKVAMIYSGLSYEDEEKARKKEEEIKIKKKSNRDVGNDMERASRQARNIYWNLRDIFGHHRGGWRW